MRAALRDPEVVYRRRWLTLLVLCISLMVIGLDNTILNVALPTLAKPVPRAASAPSSSQLQWIVDGYTIVFAGLLLTAGSLGDRFGRYRRLARRAGRSSAPARGLSAFASVGHGADRHPGAHGRRRRVHHAVDPVDHHQRLHRPDGARQGHRRLGRRVARSASASGPITGGFLLTPLLVGLGLPGERAGRDHRPRRSGTSLVPESRDPSTPRLDPIGAVLSIAGLGDAAVGGHRGARATGGASHDHPHRLRRSASSMLAAFIVWELRSLAPDARHALLREPAASAAASGAITLTFFALFGTLFLLTQYLQSVLGYSTIKAGAVLLPQAVRDDGARARCRTCGCERFGNKVVVTAGLLMVTASLLAASAAPRVDSSTLHVIVITHAARPRHGATSWRRPPTRSWGRCPGPRPASARPSTTRPARSAARSAWRCSARSCRRSTGPG